MTLALENVFVSMSGVKILRGMAVSWSAGINGLIGPNGSGKSSSINAITGVYPIESGRVVYKGRTLPSGHPEKVARLGIGRTFQIPKPIRLVDTRGMLQLAGVSGQEADRILDRVGLGGRGGTLTTELALPELRLLELARVLACGCEAVILDEVMAGLSEGEQGRVIEAVRDLADTGVLVIMVEHVMGVIRALCETVTLVSSGRVVLSGPTKQVLEDRRTAELYLGLEI